MTFTSSGLEMMLQRHGKAAVYKSVAAGTYTAGTGFTSGSDTPENITVYYSMYKNEEVDGTSVLKGDKLAVFVPSATTIKPKNGDLIGNNRVESVREIMSEGAVVYLCQVRKYAA